MIDTEEEKENSSTKLFIYYSREPFCLHPANKIEWYESNLRRSHIQYNQITTRDSWNLWVFFLFVFLFYFCFITQAPLRQILTIFSLEITIQHLQLRGIFGSNIGQCRSEKKYVWPAQSQNDSWKQQLDNWRINSCMLMDDFQQGDSEGNGFSKKTFSETISRYMKFINSNCGAHSLCSKWSGEGGRGKGKKRGRKTGVWGLDPRFSSALAPPPPSPLHLLCRLQCARPLGEGGP